MHILRLPEELIAVVCGTLFWPATTPYHTLTLPLVCKAFGRACNTASARMLRLGSRLCLVADMLEAAPTGPLDDWSLGHAWGALQQALYGVGLARGDSPLWCSRQQPFVLADAYGSTTRGSLLCYRRSRCCSLRRRRRAPPPLATCPPGCRRRRRPAAYHPSCPRRRRRCGWWRCAVQRTRAHRRPDRRRPRDCSRASSPRARRRRRGARPSCSSSGGREGGRSASRSRIGLGRATGGVAPRPRRAVAAVTRTRRRSLRASSLREITPPARLGLGLLA